MEDVQRVALQFDHLLPERELVHAYAALLQLLYLHLARENSLDLVQVSDPLSRHVIRNVARIFASHDVSDDA